mgnify:CR=1 FL=1
MPALVPAISAAVKAFFKAAEFLILLVLLDEVEPLGRPRPLRLGPDGVVAWREGVDGVELIAIIDEELHCTQT